MNIDPIVLSIPIYFLLIGIELLVQQFTRRKLYRMNDAVTNISCGITQQIMLLFFKVFSIGVYQLIYENFAIFKIPTTWASLLVLFVAVDFFYYWAHRKSHEINLFWGSHVVHHQSEDYNLSVALRQGSFQVVWTFAFYLPLAIIGFKTLDFVLMAGLTTVYQFWIHTETIRKLGPLEYVFNTPSHHRVHHGKDPKYIDKNHAGVFIVWDKMFGTFQAEEEKPTYGITRPVNSWNPVWANFEHYFVMWQNLKLIRGVCDKLKFIFKRPGWYPKYMGGYQPARKVDHASYRKFDLQSPYEVNFYVLFQYILTLLGTALFLFNQDFFPLYQKALIAIAVIITIVNCGALFENRRWIRIVEIGRVLIFSGFVLYISFLNQWQIILLGLAVFYPLISIGWLVNVFKRGSKMLQSVS